MSVHRGRRSWVVIGSGAAAAAGVLVLVCVPMLRSGDAQGGDNVDGSVSAAPTPDPGPATRTPSPRHKGSANVAEPAPSQIDAHRPTAIELPSGTLVHTDATATGADGALMIPSDVERAGWWDGSSRLGDPFGGIVVAAHVDSFSQGLGHFAELLSAQPGEHITVQAATLSQQFRIVSADLVPKAEVRSGADIFSPRGAPRLVLITCGGPYDRDTGYQDNLVVIAVPIGRIARAPA